ncbi:MAG: glycosyltransferase [Bacteroidota bacterium]|nr:glycosyltransferase [Bacteroidota bacterium]
MNKQNNILIIGSVWPEPDSSAAGSRMMQLISLFLRRKDRITFASAAADSEFMFDVSTIGIDRVPIELNNESFDTFIKQLQPTMVLFDRFMTEEQYGWRVAENCPDALRMLDTEDLHCLRVARQLAFKEKRELKTSNLHSDHAKREVASICRCDLSLMISDVEMNILKKEFKVDESLLHYVPFLLDSITQYDVEVLSQFSERSHFISIGNFLHEPNWNAVQYLKESIWPLIRKKLPQIELHIYGAYPSQKVEALHNAKDGFLIKGRAADAKEVMRRAKVCLAPLRFGAGIKGKLVEAMQCGTPSVTTDIGAEAMHGNLPWSGFIKNSPEEIAEAAVKLYIEENAWKQARENGFKIINKIYAKELHVQKLIDRIIHLQENLENHRLNNFTGAMLMHHTMTGTKYMAKWIEEKNSR